MERYAIYEGINSTRVPGVTLTRATRFQSRSPSINEPSVVIVGQGRKRGLSGEVYVYDANNYLVLSVPLPLECETEASPEFPVWSMTIQVEMTTLSELLLEMEDTRPIARDRVPRAIASRPLTAAMEGAAVRLLECLESPTESRVLGRPIVREFLFRVLCGDEGEALRAVAARHSHCGQIGNVLRQIHASYSEDFRMETLAREASMSVSAFHRHFKAVTTLAPLQYIKSIRLHKARMLMVRDGLDVGIVAKRVGYDSPSQFSREYKRFFGTSPSGERGRVQGGQGGVSV